MRRSVNPPGAAPAIGPFSQAIAASGALLFVSGQGPQDPVNGGFDLSSFEAEVRLTLDNLTRVLHGAGTDWAQVLRVGVYLRRAEDFAEFNRIYAEYAVAPYPARTLIICDLLAGISVEVDCVARIVGEG